jgi:hypothetical protein
MSIGCKEIRVEEECRDNEKREDDEIHNLFYNNLNDVYNIMMESKGNVNKFKINR